MISRSQEERVWCDNTINKHVIGYIKANGGVSPHNCNIFLG